MNYGFDDIKQLLTEKGLKATQQRLVIYQSVLNSHFHPTAERIYEEVKIQNPSISLATIYNTLDTLIEAELVNRVPNEDGTLRYDGNIAPHDHVFCTNTREIIDYEDPELKKLLQKYFQDKQVNNFRIKDISVQISGEKLNGKEPVSIT